MNKTVAEQSTQRAAANPHLEGPGAPRRRHRTGIIIAAVVLLLLGGVWWINHRQAAAAGPAGARRGGGRGGFGGPNAPLPVGVRAVTKGDIHVRLDALGTVTAAHSATLRSQITGQLQQIVFQEGQLVHAGDLLAIIDPRPYENALAQAKAQLQQAQSQLQTAELDLQRYETLAKEDSIAKQLVDNTRAQVNQYQGTVQSAEAAMATANLNISYCHIKAPFDGRVGLRMVDPGNYVTPGDANGIVVITQTKPITVIFTLPEDNMGAVATKLRAGEKLEVDAYDRTQTKKVAAGMLTSMDNQIDPTTGTFKLRGEFANDDEALFPNQFVNVTLLLDTLHDVPVIPTSAVERGQQGTFVYVVATEQTAQARQIVLGATEGESVEVKSGLQVGDQIVIDGADRLKDGQKIILNTGDQTPHRGPGVGGPAAGEAGKKWGKRGPKKAEDSGGKE